MSSHLEYRKNVSFNMNRLTNETEAFQEVNESLISGREHHIVHNGLKRPIRKVNKKGKSIESRYT